jgi:hypothetical protein
LADGKKKKEKDPVPTWLFEWENTEKGKRQRVLHLQNLLLKPRMYHLQIFWFHSFLFIYILSFLV